MADMLSGARYNNEDSMVSKGEEVGIDFFELARMLANGRSTPTLLKFNENDYDEEWLQIGQFLSLMTNDALETKEEASHIRKKAYKFFLRDGVIWRHAKKQNGTQL